MGWVAGVALLLALGVLIHLTLGWDALLAPWAETPPRVLAVASLLLLASYGLRTIRIHGYFLPSTSGRFPRTLRLVLVHNLFNNLLPMRTGEASFPILMARDFRVPMSHSLPGLLYLRSLDLHFVILLGLGVLAAGQGVAVWIWVLFGLLIPVPFLAFRGQRWLIRRIQGKAGRWWTLLRNGLEGLPASPGLFWTTWFWTAANWSVKLGVLAWILQAFSPMPFSHALFGTATGELSSVLPIHGLAGAGTYEGGVLAGLLPKGIELEAALKAAVNLHLFVLGVSIGAGVVAMLFPLQPSSATGSLDDS